MLRAARWTVVFLLVVAAIGLAFSAGYYGRDTDDGGAGPAVDTEAPGQVEVDSEEAPDFRVLDEIYDILVDDYVEPDILDGQSLFEASVNGLLDSLSDSGTFYVDPTTYRVNVLPSGTFEGIGATVSQQGDEIVILAPIKGTPAEAAGILPGDVILEVDGESTEGWTVEKAVLKIRGPKGSDVTLGVRHADGTEEVLNITRDEIRVESISTVPPGGILQDGDGNEVTELAYVQIREFTGRSRDELRPILEEIQDSDYEGLVVDLRGNPGGLLSATVDVADMFLDSGIILVQVDRDGEERVFNARRGGEAVDIPVVVLINSFSASGAEVLAAAIQDNGRGLLVGEKSFGKGTVNIARPLGDGGALFVSIARWLTPDRIQIDGVGIPPDVEITLTDEDIDERRDAQLIQAVDILRGQAVTPSPAPVEAGAE